MKRFLISVAALGLATSAAAAADLAVQVEEAPVAAAPSWFVDVGVGASFSSADSLTFINPIGTNFTSNDTRGNEIILDGVDKSDTSWAANVALGYFVTPNAYIKGAYRYFGEHDATGSATFFAGDFEQKASVQAHGLFVGAGYVFDLNQSFYLDAAAEIGASFLRTKATQGANIGFSNTFPSNTETNFAAGASLGVGYRMTSDLDLTLTGSYHYLGSAETGVTGFNSPNMNPDEQLKVEDIGVASVMAGVRVKF